MQAMQKFLKTITIWTKKTNTDPTFHLNAVNKLLLLSQVSKKSMHLLTLSSKIKLENKPKECYIIIHAKAEINHSSQVLILLFIELSENAL